MPRTSKPLTLMSEFSSVDTISYLLVELEFTDVLETIVKSCNYQSQLATEYAKRR